MLLNTALFFGSFLTVVSTTPIQARDRSENQALKDVSQVLDRLVATVTTVGNHISAWPGNPNRVDSLKKIVGYVPLIKQDCSIILSDLQIGTDWIQRNRQTTIGPVDAMSLVPKLTALNIAVNSYKDGLIAKRAWADTSSMTPDLYDQLVIQKNWAFQLASSITQSLGITTSWLGGPVSDFFFGSKLDEAINAYSDGGKIRPNTVPAQPIQQGGSAWKPQQGAPPVPPVPYNPVTPTPGSQLGAPPVSSVPYNSIVPTVGSQSSPNGRKGQNGPFQQQGQPQYPNQGQWGYNMNTPSTPPIVQEQPQEEPSVSFQPGPRSQDDKRANGPYFGPSISP
ncbi:hypothetical protein FKW77_003433 [Venturia effusa]|uniref:NACHT-NTPase and P-loop NTPases N-terminal domain-containing protein n=1 Tax=Venturia effusa TaxID=50376 RepID=A0A517LGX3_9PEZI|nr:hypothetical protein FKW77_003433 [Venturia effusa]